MWLHQVWGGGFTRGWGVASPGVGCGLTRGGGVATPGVREGGGNVDVASAGVRYSGFSGGGGGGVLPYCSNA